MQLAQQQASVMQVQLRVHCWLCLSSLLLNYNMFFMLLLNQPIWWHTKFLPLRFGFLVCHHCGSYFRDSAGHYHHICCRQLQGDFPFCVNFIPICSRKADNPCFEFQFFDTIDSFLTSFIKTDFTGFSNMNAFTLIMSFLQVSSTLVFNCNWCSSNMPVIWYSFIVDKFPPFYMNLALKLRLKTTFLSFATPLHSLPTFSARKLKT